jgi:hypothetical protein
VHQVKFLSLFIVLATLLGLPNPLRAAEFRVEDLGDGLSMVAIMGEIKRGDNATFRREAAKLENAVVVLESPGGATVDAIEIGETIRIRGFSTLVMNGSYCVSACGLIWLAGTPRTLSRTAYVGFHATYIDENGTKLESGVGNALVGRYFAILNLPQKAIIFATSAAPDQANWVTAENAVSLGIDVKIIDDFEADTVEEALPPPSSPIAIPPPIQTYPSGQRSETTLWSNTGDWVVFVDHSLGDSCFALKSFDDGTTFRLGLDLKYEKSSYVMIHNEDWASIEEGKEYPITIKIDNYDPWDAPTVGTRLGDLIMLYVAFDDTKFWAEFSAGRIMKLGRNSRDFASMYLGESEAAVEKVVECQDAANKIRAKRDPFAQ